MQTSLKSLTFRRVSQHLSQAEYIQDFEDESQECDSTKMWIFVWMSRVNIGHMDFAKSIRFSHISQIQDACGKSLLNTNS